MPLPPTDPTPPPDAELAAPRWMLAGLVLSGLVLAVVFVLAVSRALGAASDPPSSATGPTVRSTSRAASTVVDGPG